MWWRRDRPGCGRCADVERLERAVADARQAQAEAEQAEQQSRAEKDQAWEHVDRLTKRLGAIDADRLRGERDDLLLENATLRARLELGDRSELVRARETIARLEARLEAVERGVVTL
ncbi:hypothetical protein ABZ897_15735 [Nonomuraea sp. NPDC046802]|uniref:hypothetical protein n=1 Tax=Nonomuraea sp. NPDC046802 TaxID=3154919 RepID=UPI0033DC16BC